MSSKKWNRVDDKPPEIGVWVEVIRIDESHSVIGVVWSSIGRLRESGNWTIKSTDGLTLRNSKPTHWRKLKNEKEIQNCERQSW